MPTSDTVSVGDEQIGEAISEGPPIDSLEFDGVALCSNTLGEVLGFATVEEADAFLVGFVEEATGKGGREGGAGGRSDHGSREEVGRSHGGVHGEQRAGKIRVS